MNQRFVEACATGDYQSVLFILESIKDFNIDVSDNLGRTALRLAVASEHLEVSKRSPKNTQQDLNEYLKYFLSAGGSSPLV